jgi:hypothetical protein
MSRAFCYNVFETLMQSVTNTDVDAIIEALDKTRACDAYARCTYFRVIINDNTTASNCLKLKSHRELIQAQAKRGMIMTGKR